MSTTKNIVKRVYVSPEIEFIELDREISLALESDPPYGPEETMNHPDNFNIEPFKAQTV